MTAVVQEDFRTAYSFRLWPLLTVLTGSESLARTASPPGWLACRASASTRDGLLEATARIVPEVYSRKNVRL
ncbi:MAG: hypothetical protein AUI03_07975 [Nitrospirae bacterium 13_2_20CM_2_62_8]|nr:MAG: hypothetical protein AUI03_07975 [Nitrospirae bacterium 13_2_20CM_2_62_8]